MNRRSVTKAQTLLFYLLDKSYNRGRNGKETGQERDREKMGKKERGED